MATPTYLLERIARHADMIDRLRSELQERKGDFGLESERQALAFEAADFVWAYLAVAGNDKVQGERWLRNRIAEGILGALREAETNGLFASSPEL